MGIRPCKIVELPEVAVYDVLDGLTKVEDLDIRWQKGPPGNPLTYACYRTGEYSPTHILIEAVAQNKISFIPYLCEKENALLNLGDTYGWTALHYAVYEKQFLAVTTLLDLNADPNLSSIRSKDNYQEGTTSLDIALIHGSIDMAALLLKFDAQTDGIDKRVKLSASYYCKLKGAWIYDDVKYILDAAKEQLDQERQKTADQIDDAVFSFNMNIPKPLSLLIAAYV